MNSFHRPAEERIEPYNSKLLIIPKISRSPYHHTSWETKSVLQEKMNRMLKGKDEIVFFIYQNLSHFVPIITVFPNVTLKEKYIGKN